MNTTVTPSAISGLASNSSPSFKPWQHHPLLEDCSYDFATIDGDVVTFQHGSMAVNSGAGILIGDYYVGITDHYAPSGNSDFILY